MAAYSVWPFLLLPDGSTVTPLVLLAFDCYLSAALTQLVSWSLSWCCAFSSTFSVAQLQLCFSRLLAFSLSSQFHGDSLAQAPSVCFTGSQFLWLSHSAFSDSLGFILSVLSMVLFFSLKLDLWLLFSQSRFLLSLRSLSFFLNLQ